VHINILCFSSCTHLADLHISHLHIYLFVSLTTVVLYCAGGNTPLHIVSEAGPSHRALIQRIIERGADITVRNKREQTAADVAQSMGHKQIPLFIRISSQGAKFSSLSIHRKNSKDTKIKDNITTILSLKMALGTVLQQNKALLTLLIDQTAEARRQMLDAQAKIEELHMELDHAREEREDEAQARIDLESVVIAEATFIGSRLLTNHYKYLLCRWIWGDNINDKGNNEEKKHDKVKVHVRRLERKPFVLVYRGSRDGFSATAFHKQCDDKGPTVVVINSGNGNIFGGYTPLSWTSKNIDLIDETRSTFLFILKNHTKGFKPCKMVQYQNHSIECYQANLSCFGGKIGDQDIYIHNECSKGCTSSSNLGKSFQLPKPYIYGQKDAKALLAGREWFTVTDIEVFAFHD